VARAEGLQPVLDEIVDAARRLCHGEHAQLYLREGELLRIFSASDDDPRSYDYAQQHPHAVDRSTVVGRVALAGDVVQIPDVQADPDYIYEGQALQGYEALLGVPILHDEELIGVIAVGRDTAGAFADEHVTLVRTFADQAAIAIANARLLAAVERQRTELSRFLSPQIAALVSSPEGEQLLAGHRAYVTVMFCDLRGFTAFVETAAPEELFEVLRSYHRLIGELIAQYGGTLEHFAGDGVMVFFNDPIPVPDHERQAIQAALALRERFEELARYWSKRGVDLGLGIGITVGYATLGRIGFEGRYDYGALGPVTNLASRLSSHASAGQILIAQRVYAAVEESVAVEPVGEIELKGFARPVPAYNVLELTEPPERSGAR
jgi:adenylate cyclase